MPLPEMSSLQFLVVGCLFSGRQSSVKLRAAINAAGQKISPTSLCKLMCRMEKLNFVCRHYRKTMLRNCRIRECHYEVTDLGLAIWKKTRAFYADAPLPPAELTPLPTDEGPLADRPRAVRQNILRHRLRKQLQDLFRPLLNASS